MKLWLPTRVTPPPFAVPTLMLTNSPIRLCEPIVERRVRAALVAQVLRRAAEHGAVLNAVIAADRHAAVAAADPRMRLDDGSGPDLDLAVDDAVRADLRSRRRSWRARSR